MIQTTRRLRYSAMQIGFEFTLCSRPVGRGRQVFGRGHLTGPARAQLASPGGFEWYVATAPLRSPPPSLDVMLPREDTPLFTRVSEELLKETGLFYGILLESFVLVDHGRLLKVQSLWVIAIIAWEDLLTSLRSFG